MKHQSGNVLFLILIAVALFAALSYAVTRSTRSGGSAKKEQLRTTAASILDFAATMRTAMMRMKVSNGCADNQFDFSNGVYKLADGQFLNVANSNAPANGTCKLFAATGGGVAPVLFSPTYFDFSPGYDATPGHSFVRTAQVAREGTDSPGSANSNELLMSIMYLKKDLCMAINDLAGIPNPSGAPPNGPVRYDGDYVNGDMSGNTLYNDAAITGRSTFCIYAGSHHYEFVQVLVAR